MFQNSHCFVEKYPSKLHVSSFSLNTLAYLTLPFEDKSMLKCLFLYVLLTQ